MYQSIDPGAVVLDLTEKLFEQVLFVCAMVGPKNCVWHPKKSLLSSRFSMICVANYAWVSAAGLWAIQYSRSITTKTWPWDLNTSEVVSHRKRRFTADNMQPHIQALRVGPSICWTWFRIADSWPCWNILIQKITSLQRETKTHAVYSGWQCGSCW